MRLSTVSLHNVESVGKLAAAESLAYEKPYAVVVASRGVREMPFKSTPVSQRTLGNCLAV